MWSPPSKNAKFDADPRSSPAAATDWAPRTPPPSSDHLRLPQQLKKAQRQKASFTIGIEDDVYQACPCLKVKENPDTTAPREPPSCKFWGLGSDGTVGANKNSIKIIGDHTDMYAQGYFSVRLEKVGRRHHLPSALRQKAHQEPPIYVNKADFVACHNPSYIDKYDKMVEDRQRPAASSFSTASWDAGETRQENLPAKAKRYIAKHDIKFYTIDGVEHRPRSWAWARRINTILQSRLLQTRQGHPLRIRPSKLS